MVPKGSRGLKLLLLIVDYNGFDHTVAMVESILRINIIPEIHIIDNGSLSEEQFRRHAFPEALKHKIQIFPLAENHGYFGAVAEHLKRIDPSDYDWIFISNNDIVFNDCQIFDRLDQIASASQFSVGVYCPKVLSGNTKENLNPYLKYEPSKHYYLKSKVVLSSYWLASIYEMLSELYHVILHKHFIHRIEESTVPEPIFAPHGAFIGLSRAFFAEGGYVESDNFLYFEEEILGYICKKVGVRVLYDPRVSVTHAGHASTGKKYSEWKHTTRKQSLGVFKRYLRFGSQQGEDYRFDHEKDV